MIRKSFLFVVSLLLVPTSVIAQSSAKKPIVSARTTPLLDTPHEKFATFLAGEEFKSVLLLENFRPDVAITFTPVLILSVGEVPLNPVTVPAHSTATVDISAILRDRSYPDTRGTVAVRFDFATYGPGSAIVLMRDEKHQLYLNSYAQSPEEYWSGTAYDAVVWAPQEGTEGFVSVTNASTETHLVHTTFLVNGQGEQHQDMELAPRQTRMISLDALLARSRKSGGGIHVEYSQGAGEEYPGAILVEGQLFNKETGFAKHIHFIDKALPPTSTLRTHFLMLGRQPSEDNFPANMSFRSVAAVRNIDTVPVTVTPTVKFLRNGSLETLSLPSRVLPPAGSSLIDFNQEQKAGHLPADFIQGSLALTPDSSRNSIVGELFNFSSTGGYVIGPSFSSYPSRSTSSIWRTDGSFQTTIMVENTADKDDRVTVHLYSDQSAYAKTFSLPTGKLLKINVRDLQQNGVLDDNGNPLLGSSGVLSLVGSHNTRSKLSYDKIIHSANQSDYVGYPPTACDYVTSIALFVDMSSGTQPFAVMKDYEWTQTGTAIESAFGSSSGDSSLAQVSNDGSVDWVTFTPPDDGQVHSVTLWPEFPQEIVTFCVACSGGDVAVIGVSLDISISTQNYIFNGMEGSACHYNLFCPNGNTFARCNIEPILVPGPPVNTCLNYLHNHSLVINKKCFPVGKAELATFPVPCN